jgi:cell division protein ZapA (FtsZ GTPase activity inhibitor)
MSIVTITLSNRDFKLFCPEENHTELNSLAEKLDLEINKIKQTNPSASFELSLVMLALNLLDNKQKHLALEGGEILKDANTDFQIVLSSIFDELKTVAKKLEKC